MDHFPSTYSIRMFLRQAVKWLVYAVLCTFVLAGVAMLIAGAGTLSGNL